MDWSDAYAIQDEIRRRKESRGNKIIGLKAGLTSFAKTKQMAVASPVFGFVADYMACIDAGEIKTSELIHPKIEAQICVVTNSLLQGPSCHVAAVMAAVDFVVPAVEVIDSRYRDFKFDLKSVIADNTSSSRFVTGGRMRPLAAVAEKQASLQFTTSDQLGELAVFLCSPAAENIRGQAWSVDGGWTAQ